MADRATEQLLSSFADHLLRNQLSDERHSRFMLHWVRRYLVHPPPVSNASPEELMDAYLGQLRKEDLKEWAWFWAFPSRTLAIDPESHVVRRWHATDSALQKMIAEAARQAGIPKRVTPHCLRHSFT